MPTFKYEALNGQGQTVRDTIEAENKERAIELIREQGLFPTKITETWSKSPVPDHSPPERND